MVTSYPVTSSGFQVFFFKIFCQAKNQPTKALTIYQPSKKPLFWMAFVSLIRFLTISVLDPFCEDPAAELGRFQGVCHGRFRTNDVAVWRCCIGKRIN